jgi:RES domain-containing protein
LSVITKAGENASALKNGNCKYSKGLASLVQSIDLAECATHHAAHAGDTWLNEAAAPVLQVVSTVLPEEPNYVLNPKHPNFQKSKSKLLGCSCLIDD